MGSLLFWSSEHSVSLHKLLAVRPPFRPAGVDYYRDGPSWCAWSVRGVPGDDAGRDGIAEAALDMSVAW
jgi:hypothetical protein